MSATDTPVARGKLLDEYAATLGTSWARSLSEAVLRERRAVAGGFPGTLPEARWQVARYFAAELERRALSPLRPEETLAAVDAAYARARREWLLLVRAGERAPQRRGKNGHSRWP